MKQPHQNCSISTMCLDAYAHGNGTRRILYFSMCSSQHYWHDEPVQLLARRTRCSEGGITVVVGMVHREPRGRRRVSGEW